MLPVANSITIYNPITSPLVNTVMPGTTVAHVPYDNVAPSVSNAQVDNNTKGNNATAPPEQPPPMLPDESVDAAFSAYLNNASGMNINAQATFLAQLIGQDISIPPETAGILAQYEKMVSFSNVKYKPSNAMKPAPEPSGAFGQILHQDTMQPAQPLPPPAPVMPPVAQQRSPAADQVIISLPENNAPQVTDAYAATALRADNFATASVANSA